MASNKEMTEILGLLFIVIVALALTPTIGTSVVNAKYVPETEYKIVDAAVSNDTTALTYAARNDSATYAWFTITLNDTSAYGLTTVECATNITYTVGTKIITFKVGVLTGTKDYNCTITYYWQYITGAGSALLDIVPLLWVVTIVAAVIVVVTKKLNVW